MIRAISLLGTVLLLCGCNTNKTETATTTAPAKAPTTKTYDKTKKYDKKAYAPIATREYLYAGERVPDGYGAYGYLVFTSDPTSTEKERYLAACSAFKGYLPQTLAASAEERTAQMVTFWPLKERGLGDRPTCEQLIADYDADFAARIAAAVRMSGVRGPLLVAWKTPDTTEKSESLILDMSNFSNKDLSRAIQLWKDRIAMDPAHWRNGWNAALVKEEFRNVIENILPGVVTIVGAWFPKPSK